MAKQVILIEGNICAGKTTLTNYLNDNRARFDEFLDPGEEFRSIVEFIDHSWLQLFYRDRGKYTSWFEKSCLIGRIGRHFVAKEHRGIVLFDRGMLGGASTFCRNSFEDGFLRYNHWQEYQQMLRSGLDDLDRSEQGRWLERLLIYLRVGDVGVLRHRQRCRSTAGEDIPAGYLERIGELYEGFIADIGGIYNGYGLKPPRVLTIDAEVDFLEDKSRLEEVMGRILETLRRETAGDSPRPEPMT